MRTRSQSDYHGKRPERICRPIDCRNKRAVGTRDFRQQGRNLPIFGKGNADDGNLKIYTLEMEEKRLPCTRQVGEQ